MKKIILSVLILVTFMVSAQENDSLKSNSGPTPIQNYKRPINHMPDPMNNLKINLLSPFYSNLSLFFQHVVDDDNSIQLGASYMSFSGYGGNTSSSSGGFRTNELTTSYSFTPEYRYNLNGKNLSGAYFSGFMRYTNMQYSFDEDSSYYYYGTAHKIVHRTYEYTSLGIGLMVGAQTIYKRRVTFDVYVGPVYNILLSSTNKVSDNSDIQKSDDIPGLYLRGYGIRAGFCVGFTF